MYLPTVIVHLILDLNLTLRLVVCVRSSDEGAPREKVTGVDGGGDLAMTPSGRSSSGYCTIIIWFSSSSESSSPVQTADQSLDKMDIEFM